MDLELAARLTSTTQATLSLEWLNSRFTSFANPTGAPARNYVGNELPYAPRLSLGLGVQQRWTLPEGHPLRLDAALRHARQRYTDPANTPALRTPEEVYVDAGATLAPSNSQWTFSVKVRNLFDKTHVLIPNVIPALGVEAGYYNAPSTTMVSARYDF